MSHSKRSILKFGGALALSWAASASSAAITPKFKETPFQMGVTSGSPSADGFVIWTRILGDELPDNFLVGWEIMDDDKKSIVAKGKSLCQKDLGFSVHAEITGLHPNRWYSYRFWVGDAQSQRGRARTLPIANDTNVSSLRLAYASCQRLEDGHYAAYRAMLEDAPDFVVFLGDYIYEYESRAVRDAVRSHGLRRARTLDDFRQRYQLYRSDPALQAMHAACPWLVTWDDHEVENNYNGSLSAMGTAANQFASVRCAAYQAYYENMPLRRSAVLGGIEGLKGCQQLKIYDSYDFGRLARIYLLDNRQYRTPPPCPSKGHDRLNHVCHGSDRANESMLGPDQERWLEDSLAEAKDQGTYWHLIAQQTRITPSNYMQGGPDRNSADSWAAYPASRQRLVNSIRRFSVNGALLIGGDIHQNWVANVHADLYNVNSPVVASEFCGTSISSRTQRTQSSADRVRERNPHCLLFNSEKRGYGLVDLTRERARVALRTVRQPNLDDSPIDTLAEFEVIAGDARIRGI